MWINFRNFSKLVFFVLMAMSAASGASSADSVSEAEAVLEGLQADPHLRQISLVEKTVVAHEVGLGAMRKVSGKWRFKDSERLSGTLRSYTWQVVDGFTSAQVLQKLSQSITNAQPASLLFACQGRACGQGAQWANRVFRERLLYGREALQSYAVFTFNNGTQYRLMAYSGSRSEDRQYLRVDLLRISE